jgi:spore germination protein YaaH/peptidoglycan/xylan/chitin deacetylase (PgdA/CDA1 family)
MTSPVFFDSTGKRRRLVGRLIALLLSLIVISALAFATTIVRVPASAALGFDRERQQPLPFKTHIARWKHRIPQWGNPAGAQRPINAAFYVPWDEESVSALRTHYDRLDWVIASNAWLDRKTLALKVQIDTPLRTLVRSRLHRPKLFLMVQNVDDKVWFGPEMSRLFHDPRKSDALVEGLIAATKRVRWQGVVFDIENLPNETLPAYRDFLARAHARFAKAGLLMSVTVPAGEPAWNLKRFSDAVDHVIFMDYDQHWQGGEAGPIAAQNWFASMLADARSKIPAAKLIIALGNYGYDWHDGIADALTVNEAWLAAHDSGATPAFDPASSNSGFAYDEGGTKHTVWLMDAATSWNQLAQLRGGVAGIALWRLGSEDPGYWEAVAAWQARRMPRLETIAPAPGTDIDGSGEILRIAALPKGGRRTIRFGKDGMIVDEKVSSLPSPYVVQRTGAADSKKIALTFDDGPDPTWTPRILDILKRERCPATFFIIGENALSSGSCSAHGAEGMRSAATPTPIPIWPAPDARRVPAQHHAAAVPGLTGRSLRLFRAPYFGDAEPTTADEIEPALQAQNRGYISVGLHVDPGDWKRPGVKRSSTRRFRSPIARLHRRPNAAAISCCSMMPAAIASRRSRRCRRSSISCVPRAISSCPCRAGGPPRDVAMPGLTERPGGGRDRSVHLRRDRRIITALGWIFLFAISIGIARAIILSALALIQARREGRTIFPTIDPAGS